MEKITDVWECKIGGNFKELPNGADYPMRLAVAKAYKEITGCDANFCFSGWGSKLTKLELLIINDDI